MGISNLLLYYYIIILYLGGYHEDGYLTDILMFNNENGGWSKTGDMMFARSSHAITALPTKYLGKGSSKK